MRRFNAVVAVLLAAGLSACATRASVSIKPGYDFSRVRRVALLGVDDYPGRGGSGRVAEGALERRLLGAGYSLVERRRVGRLLEEQALGVSGAVEPSVARKLGKLLEVDAVVLGGVTTYRPARQETVVSTIREERREPIIRRVTRRKKEDDKWIEVEEDEVQGFNTIRTRRQEPRTVTHYAELGLSARMVDVATGEVLWAGSAADGGLTLEEAAESAATRLFAALKATLPSAPTLKK